MGLFNMVFKGLLGLNKQSQQDIDFEVQVKNDGYKYAGKKIADLLNEKITSEILAKQFLLEELDSARQGNDYAKAFVKNSGFKSVEYVGAINKTQWKGTESKLEHLQLLFRSFTVKIRDIDLKAQVSVAVTDEIMKRWGLGKYANYDPEIAESLNELTKLLQKEEVKNALQRTAIFGVFEINQMKNIKKVNDIIYKLTKLTGKTSEEILQNPTNLTRKKEEYISTKNEEFLNKLIEWANKYNLPELRQEEHIITSGFATGFPRDKKILMELEILNLPNCKIKHLPKEILGLKNLKRLWLEDNNLTYLPDEICNLTLLEEVYIPNNNIKKLPENIGNLQNLVELYFKDNDIEILPESIGNLRNLTEINFKQNKIKCLPVSLILLNKLQKIDFRGQKHGGQISTPIIADLILKGCFDNNQLFKKQLFIKDENNWNDLKNNFRNLYMSDITINVDNQKISYLQIIENIYGKEIANNQESSYFIEIAKL